MLERVSHTCSDGSHSHGCWKPHNVRSTVLSFWIISRTRGMSQMESRLAVVFCNQDAGRKSVDNRKIDCARAVQSCYSCYKMSTVKAKYHCYLQPDQHSLSVVISICGESASVSSFAEAVTCSRLGLTASCPHHQFRQCRRLWRGETLGQMCVAQCRLGNADCKWFFNRQVWEKEKMMCKARSCCNKEGFYQE